MSTANGSLAQEVLLQWAGSVQGFLGLYQFNVKVANVAASDTIPFTFTLGEAKGQQTLLIPVQ